ncbi:MAG: hypothetical protein IT341_04885 [Chloroflexi bacterium]|nr:hypothetical protein [Chloroflexota bacterium]
MSTAYSSYRPRNGLGRLFGWADDFMSWMLFGHETWLIAMLKAVPLFLFLYFALFYVSNYIYYLVTVEIPFLKFSEEVGYLIANGAGMTTFAAIVVFALVVQASRGRRGVVWAAVRIFVGLNYLLTVLVIIPIMAFNLAGGSLWPVRITLETLAFGAIAAGLGAAACVYLAIEFRRITGRQAADAERLSTELARR